ncbi:MAG: GGDEF domain-containing protein [Bacillota bacterium]|nr:GGDEF domain-containing protein [Bacillota bacterium]
MESVMFLAIMTILSAVAFWDIFLYARSSRHLTDWGRMIRISYILFVIAMLVVFLRISMRKNREAKLAEQYKLQSRTDAMTGLWNKGAYLEREEELTEQLIQAGKKGKMLSFVVMALDLNNLKKVNDHLGHDMGDQYIITASGIFLDAIGRDGEIYRVGGDEFLILIFGSDPEEAYRNIVSRLKEKTDAYNSEKDRGDSAEFCIRTRALHFRSASQHPRFRESRGCGNV